MKIALIRSAEVNPYWTRMPALGISYISSYLKSNGLASKIFDANYNAWTDDLLTAAVLGYKPDVIGFTSMTHEISKTHNIASKLRRALPGVPTVIGGCHVTALPKETLEEFPAFTYGVFGEGEKTMYQLIRSLETSSSPEGLKAVGGLAYRDPGGVRVNAPRERLSSSDLDGLPYPAFEEYYNSTKALAGKRDFYVMMTSRGCPYNCAFCMQVLGRQVRRRSPEKIVEEMEYAIEAYGAHTIYFYDEIFLFNDELTHLTLELMIKRGLPKRARWLGMTRVNLVDEKMVKKAKEAGCFFIQLGVESGSNRILREVNKNITVEQARKAVGLVKKAGIAVEADYILGHPNETPESIKATIDLAAELNTDKVGIGIMIPYPGTRVFEMAKRGEGGYKLLTTDWSKYDKYGGQALELKGLPIKELEKWQRKGFLYFYLKNLRLLELARFIIAYRRSIINLLLKHYKKDL